MSYLNSVLVGFVGADPEQVKRKATVRSSSYKLLSERDRTTRLCQTRQERTLLCERQVLRIPYCVPGAFKEINGHRVGGRHPTHYLAGWEARGIHHFSNHSPIARHATGSVNARRRGKTLSLMRVQKMTSGWPTIRELAYWQLPVPWHLRNGLLQLPGSAS